MLKIKYIPQPFVPCPKGSHVAVIVDATEPASIKGKFGVKKQFRFILEIDQVAPSKKRFTVSSAPMSLSYHEKSSLRKFTEDVLGRSLTDKELAEGVDPEMLIGKACNIIVKHVPNADKTKTYANIVFLEGLADKSPTLWQSQYERIEDREGYSRPRTEEEELNEMETDAREVEATF